MKYAHEIITLMSVHPYRDWKMVQIVRHVCPSPASTKERNAVHRAVLRVMHALEDAGTILRVAPRRNGGYATYRWKTTT